MRKWTIFALIFWISLMLFGRMVVHWSWDFILYGGVAILAVIFPIYRVKDVMVTDRGIGFVPLPIPATGFEKRTEWMREEMRRAYGLGFTPCDEMYLKFSTVDQVIFVLENPSLKINLLIMDTRGQTNGSQSLDLVSMLEGDRNLETVNTAKGAKQKRPNNRMIQAFPDTDLPFLIEKHKNAIKFLQDRGIKLIDYPGKTVRDFIASEWPKLPRPNSYLSAAKRIFTTVRPWSIYRMSIEDQVQRGTLLIGKDQ
jgi:hypothetical protein